MRSGTTPSPRRKLGASGNQKGPPQMYALSPLDLCIWFVNGKRDFASVVKVADLKIGRWPWFIQVGISDHVRSWKWREYSSWGQEAVAEGEVGDLKHERDLTYYQKRGRMADKRRNSGSFQKQRPAPSWRPRRDVLRSLATHPLKHLPAPHRQPGLLRHRIKQTHQEYSLFPLSAQHNWTGT